MATDFFDLPLELREEIYKTVINAEYEHTEVGIFSKCRPRDTNLLLINKHIRDEVCLPCDSNLRGIRSLTDQTGPQPHGPRPSLDVRHTKYHFELHEPLGVDCSLIDEHMNDTSGIPKEEEPGHDLGNISTLRILSNKLSGFPILPPNHLLMQLDLIHQISTGTFSADLPPKFSLNIWSKGCRPSKMGLVFAKMWPDIVGESTGVEGRLILLRTLFELVRYMKRTRQHRGGWMRSVASGCGWWARDYEVGWVYH
jgi:hypothetical protein